MVDGGFSVEVKVSVPPARMWKAIVTDVHVLLPKIAPQIIAGMKIVEGDGGVGTIKAVTFTSMVKGLTVLKTRIDEIDEKNFYMKYSVVDGDTEKYESSANTYKFEATEDGGSLCKIGGDYKTAGEYKPTEEEEQILGKEGFVNTFKAIEAYLQANPEQFA